VVVTNFGLLTLRDERWHLTCEERIGGLLLDVQGNDTTTICSTDTGLYEQAGNLCEWNAGPRSANNTWVLSYALATDASDAPPTSFALVASRDGQALYVERARLGEDLAVVQSFDGASGYRKLVAGGDPAAIFVTGYTFSPRTWHVAFSVDAGETWDFAAPVIGDDTATLWPRLVDPRSPRAVLVQAESTIGGADELWRFDAESGTFTRLLTLEDGETFGGIALDDDELWVAGRRSNAGSLYRALRKELVFERVSDEGPAFECLGAHEGVLYTCLNDFTRASPFLVGSSNDEGQSWSPHLRLEDLGQLTTCGEECSFSEQWLRESYGDSVTDGAAGAEPTPATHGAQSRSGCRLGPTPKGTAWLAWLAALWAALEARARARRKRRAGSMGTAVLLVACSGKPDEGTTALDSPDCGGRGDDLSELMLSSDADWSLRFVEHSPDPPALGDNSWLIEIVDEKGDALAELAKAIRVTPFMPHHGHGTPVTVGVSEEAEGQYRLAPVNTFMPGLWTIRVDLTQQNLTDSVEFDVCVQ